MPQFNLDDYVDVQDRIKAFWAQYPNGRILTRHAANSDNFELCRYVAEVYSDREDARPVATGYAFERAGQGGMANTYSHEENCETSAIGRALANLGFATSRSEGGQRPSRQEMQKVQRMEQSAPTNAPALAVATAPANNVTPIRNAPAAATTPPPAAAAYPNSAPRGCNTAMVVEYLRGSGFTAVSDFGSAIKEVDAWVKENFPGQPGIVGTGDWDEKWKQHKVFPSNIYDCAAYYLAQCEQPATDPAVTLAAGGIHVEDVEDDDQIPF